MTPPLACVEYRSDLPSPLDFSLTRPQGKRSRRGRRPAGFLKPLGRNDAFVGPRGIERFVHIYVYIWKKRFDILTHWHKSDVHVSLRFKVKQDGKAKKNKRFAAWHKTHQRLKTAWFLVCLWIFVSPTTGSVSFSSTRIHGSVPMTLQNPTDPSTLNQVATQMQVVPTEQIVDDHGPTKTLFFQPGKKGFCTW